jgi:gamma-glutamyl-gamma-aminobutyrate hydrolase PuuD
MASDLRIGLTMRVVHADGYDEPRDALAQNWHGFLREAFPLAAWLPIPNLGAPAARQYCERWGINRLILTGGEDIGTSPLRDATELDLLAWAQQGAIPVLGVCRGMQLMTVQAGGALKRVEGHVRARHELAGAITQSVNSFHAQGLAVCPAGYRVLATAVDGEIEAIARHDRRWAGWMWHPERESTFNPGDVARLRELFT